MFTRVMKLILRTRFSPSYFAVIAFVLLYSLISLSGSDVGNGYLYGDIYFTLIIGVFSTISIIFGGISVTKSDQEFLLVSAIRRRDLVPALFTAQFLASGLILLAASLITILGIYRNSALIGVAILDVILLALFSVSVGIVLTDRSLFLRAPLAAASLLWILSGYIGFRYGAISFLKYDPVLSLLTIFPVTFVSMFFAVRILSGENLPYRVSGIRRQSINFRKTSRYEGLSPSLAILKLGITQISLATRASSMGNIKSTARRIQFSVVFILFIAIAVGYGIYMLYYAKPSEYVSFPGISGINFVTIFLIIYLGSTPQMIMSSGAMAYERAWLSFMSMEPGSYVSMLIISKMIQAVIAGIPIAVASFVLYLLGVPGTIMAIPVFDIVSPFMVGVYLFMAFSVRPYQMKDENYIPARFSANQFLMILPIIGFYVIAFSLIFLPVSLVYLSPFMALVLALILTRKKYWTRRVNKMVERGFI